MLGNIYGDVVMCECLSNSQFNKIKKKKKIFTDAIITLPVQGSKHVYHVTDKLQKEKFFVDANRSGTISLGKIKIQERHTPYTILVRLEIDAPPHINPDGSKIGRDHIHIYSQGYGDRWAFDLSSFQDAHFNQCKNFYDYFVEFCQYCNIEKTEIQTVL